MQEILQKAELHNLQEIVTLFKEATMHMNESGIPQWDEIYPDEEVLLEDIVKGELLLLKKDGHIVACAVVNEDQGDDYETGCWNFTEGKVAVLHRLCVHPKAQGNGVGKKTVQLVENLARSGGYQILRLDAFSLNPSARHMYEVLGYTYAGEVTYRKGLFHLMEKQL